MIKVRLVDKEFLLFKSSREIQVEVERIAGSMNKELKNDHVIFVGILNGAFMFASDLLRKIDFNVQMSFIKLSSYPGMVSSGKVNQLIGINEDLEGRTVVILEDIIDTGNTISFILEQIRNFNPVKIIIATLLLKPVFNNRNLDIQYTGFRVPDKFIVGYGLDYKGYGRNLENLYILND